MKGEASAARALGSLSIAATLALGLGACSVTSRDPDLIAGKRAFVSKCGACHELNRAGTTGVTGPDLDNAFQRSLIDGMKRSTVKGVVLRQIGQPNRRKQMDPQTLKPTVAMPPNLVTGDLAQDVSAYVASVVAKSGKDTGRLADIGSQKSTASTSAKNGELDMPTNPSGALAYQFASATAPAGKLVIKSKNDAPIPHNISLEGNGVKQQGKVVQGGGVSEISVNLKPGQYTYYCSVPGHRQGGMFGKLTVK